MNFILCLLIVTYFCLLEVKCRSVQLDSDVHYVLEDGEDKDVNHDPESNGRFSWKRLKPILRREVQRIRNVKGETSKTNKESTSSIQAKEDGEIVEVGKKEEISAKPESELTNTGSIKPELNKSTQNEIPISELSVPEEFSANLTHLEMLQFNDTSDVSDFPDNIISDILNQSSDSILLQALKDNSSDIGSLDFDETTLLSEGGHVATLQDVSTVGFELLIDSETKQNLILAELLSSQSNLIHDDDDFDNSTDESFATILFNHANGSEIQEIVTNEEPTGNPGISEFDEDEVGTKNTDFHINNDTGTDDAEFDIDDEIETETIEFDTDEFEIEVTEMSRGEVKNVTNNENELSGTVQDDSVTENRGAESNEPKCPDPGWCIFWFLALDTCAKDSHCHGSLLCCLIGCSKTCIEPDNEV